MNRAAPPAEQQYSPAVEDYLKAIYLAQQANGIATNGQIAAQLGHLKPASVTGMLQRLAGMGLVSYTPHHGAYLTGAGEAVASRVIRHHQLIRQYLVETLGLGYDTVEAEADKLEHVISDDLEQRIAAQLAQAQAMRGGPIPRRL
jgi:DtxR family transcriptional regulator, Mn-dependent transcriptional regulator